MRFVYNELGVIGPECPHRIRQLHINQFAAMLAHKMRVRLNYTVKAYFLLVNGEQLRCAMLAKQMQGIVHRCLR